MSPLKSTIVRPSPAERPPVRRSPDPIPFPAPPPGPAVLRRTFGALERTSPVLGGALAERVWFRLPAAPSPGRRARHTPEGGMPFELTFRGRVVRGVTYGDEGRPTAHLLHGWGGWWQQLGMLVEPLLAAGYQVVAHDALSHGASDPGTDGPRTTTLVEMADVHDAVVARVGGADLVVAHSAAAMAALWAREQGTVAGAYALLAPAATVEAMFDWFGGVVGTGPRIHEHLGRRVERRADVTLDDWNVPMSLARSATQAPLLCIHDRDDDETPAQGSVDITRAWPGSELMLTTGLGHRRILRDPEVGRRVAAFARSLQP